jgi:excisionase family DNA binding protein
VNGLSLRIAPCIFSSSETHSIYSKTPKPAKKASQEDPAIWTVHEVAAYLRMNEAKVYRLAKERRLPIRRTGKTWRFRKDLLDQWLGERVELSMRKTGKSGKSDL